MPQNPDHTSTCMAAASQQFAARQTPAPAPPAKYMERKTATSMAQADPFTDDDDTRVAVAGRSFSSRRSAFGSRRGYNHGNNGASIPSAMPRFGMGSKQVREGGKVVRCYRFDVPGMIFNTASSTDGLGYSVSVRNNAGSWTLNLYNGVGISGTGTALGSFTEFATEAASFMNMFKWFTIQAIEAEFIPVVDAMTDSATSVSDQSVQSDAGVVWVTEWNGDTALVTNTTGILLTDGLNFLRYPHKTFDPIGKRTLVFAVKPTQVQVADNLLGMDEQLYPHAKPIDTSVMLSTSTEFPHYGIRWFWSHANIAANAAKFSFILRFTVRVQWNTVKDVDIQLGHKYTYEVYKGMKQRAGQPRQGTSNPVLLYEEPELDEVWDKQYNDELLKQQQYQEQLKAAREAYQAKHIEDYIQVPQQSSAPPVVKGGLPGSRPPTPRR